MNNHIEGVIPTIKFYLKEGWSIDYIPKGQEDDYLIEEDYVICSPTGSVFKPQYFRFNICPFCDEDNLGWEEGWCNHDKELLNEEDNAKNLWNLIKLAPSLQHKNLT